MNVNPGPPVTTEFIGISTACDKNPSVENTTKPPKIAVPKFINVMNVASK